MLKLRYSFALLVLVAVAALAPTAAIAEADPPSRVARLSYLTGDVSFQPAGTEEWAAATLNRPLTTADRLWTSADARAEMHVGNAALRLGPNSGFSFLNLNDNTSQVQLTQGTVSVRVRELGAREVFEIDTPNVALTLLRPGLYRVDVDPDGDFTTVTVRSGYAGANGNGQTVTIHAREQVHFSGGESFSYKVNPEPGFDAFDDWCAARDTREDRATSARYVSRGVIGYEDLDEYGSWQPVPTYGYVWYPRTVVVGWAPYRYGHWAWIGPWGWTWVDDAPWGFAPFHYGRWLWTPAGWGWVPGQMVVRPVWAPALVAWVGGAHFGVSVGAPVYGWFPLGPREVYMPWYRTSRVYVTNVNVTNTVVNNTYITRVYNHDIQHITYVNQHVHGGVTAVPERAMLEGRHIAHEHIDVPEKQWRSAEVIRDVPVTPTRHSVLGGTPSAAVRPPERAIDRRVVTFRKPPEAPRPFREAGEHEGRPTPGAVTGERTGPRTGGPDGHAAGPQHNAEAGDRDRTPSGVTHGGRPGNDAKADEHDRTPSGVSQGGRPGNDAKADEHDRTPSGVSQGGRSGNDGKAEEHRDRPATAPGQAKGEGAALPGMGRNTRDAFGTSAVREPRTSAEQHSAVSHGGPQDASRSQVRTDRPPRPAASAPEMRGTSGPPERVTRERVTDRPMHQTANPRPRNEVAPVRPPVRSAEAPRAADRPVRTSQPEMTRPSPQRSSQAPAAHEVHVPARSAESKAVPAQQHGQGKEPH